MLDEIAYRNKNLGYFLFETMRAERNSEGVLSLVRDPFHRKRLQKSMEALRWPNRIDGTPFDSWWESRHSQIPHFEGSCSAVVLRVIPSNAHCVSEWSVRLIQAYPECLSLRFHACAYRHSKNEFLQFKTGSWGQNLHFLSRSDRDWDDVIFVNERDEVCETARSNLYLLRGNEIVTPPVESGVLPGTVRQEYLERSWLEVDKIRFPLRVATIHKEELDSTSRLWVSNALMGFRPAQMLE